MNRKMNHSGDHVVDTIPAWLAGELSPALVSDLEHHLEQCPDCARAANESRTIWEALNAAAVTPAELGSPSAWSQVRARTIGKRSNGSWFYGPSAMARAGLATAAVAAGLVFAVVLPVQNLDPVGDPGEAQVETMWLEDSSWTLSDQDNGLDRMWLSAGLDTEG